MPAAPATAGIFCGVAVLRMSVFSSTARALLPAVTLFVSLRHCGEPSTFTLHEDFAWNRGYGHETPRSPSQRTLVLFMYCGLQLWRTLKNHIADRKPAGRAGLDEELYAARAWLDACIVAAGKVQVYSDPYRADAPYPAILFSTPGSSIALPCILIRWEDVVSACRILRFSPIIILPVSLSTCTSADAWCRWYRAFGAFACWRFVVWFYAASYLLLLLDSVGLKNGLSAINGGRLLNAGYALVLSTFFRFGEDLVTYYNSIAKFSRAFVPLFIPVIAGWFCIACCSDTGCLLQCYT